jgi:hypothetical protein
MGALLDASALLTHLSLSLSLYFCLSDAENGASTHLLAGFSRASERGFRHVWRRPITAARFACARVSNELGCPPHNPWGMSEEALSRAYFSRAGVVGPGAAVSFPNPGPRRSLLVCSLGKAGPDFLTADRSAHPPGRGT